ncbi:hypothetical protein GDO81_023790 [Engystomops pustulosus]|uniref:Uncharacterized protein n=1 Tax=Engystomops pustulosus TaxID=76066 RepID=A0AAV6Z5S5_ENGPU|nr:hypothetical protein GDO81_023790 [Engystomops pustulosus]
MLIVTQNQYKISDVMCSVQYLKIICSVTSQIGPWGHHRWSETIRFRCIIPTTAFYNTVLRKILLHIVLKVWVILFLPVLLKQLVHDALPLGQLLVIQLVQVFLWIDGFFLLDVLQAGF